MTLPSSLETATSQGCLLRPAPLCEVFSLGPWPYRDAWNLQRELVAKRRADTIPNVLLLLEHTPVITLGRRTDRTHLRTGPDQLRRDGIEVVETNRGGSVTFHGPGQLVGYPILDLSRIRRDVVWYVRALEQLLVQTLRDLGVPAETRSGLTGVWVGTAKIASIGVHISRWITSHGFALNIHGDLAGFRHIVPCGIDGCEITSLQQQLGRPVPRSIVEPLVVRHFQQLFGLTIQWCPPDRLERRSSCPPLKS